MATLLGEFWDDCPAGNPCDRELRLALVVDQPIPTPSTPEMPLPIWEYEDESGKSRIGIRRGTMPDEMKIVVVRL